MDTNITPADEGILAVTIDDCITQGLGDDDIITKLQHRCSDLDLDSDLAYGFYYDDMNRRNA